MMSAAFGILVAAVFVVWHDVVGMLAVMIAWQFFSWSYIMMYLKKGEPEQPQVSARKPEVEAELQRIIKK